MIAHRRSTKRAKSNRPFFQCFHPRGNCRDQLFIADQLVDVDIVRAVAVQDLSELRINLGLVRGRVRRSRPMRRNRGSSSEWKASNSSDGVGIAEAVLGFEKGDTIMVPFVAVGLVLVPLESHYEKCIDCAHISI